jgi:hypothetical protein
MRLPSVGVRDALSCKRSASIELPQRCHRVPPRCRVTTESWLGEPKFGGTFRGQDGNLYRVVERDAPKPAVVPFVEVATLFGFDVAGIGERE